MAHPASDPSGATPAPDPAWSGARIGNLVRAGLVVAAVGLGGFFVLLFHRYNAAPSFTAPTSADASGITLALEACRTTRSKISVAGWAARRGLERGRHATRVVFREAASGRLVAMRTDLVLRDDVSALLNERFHDRFNYRQSGFTASLNVGAAGLGAGSTLLAFDDGHGAYTLVPLSCSLSPAP